MVKQKPGTLSFLIRPSTSETEAVEIVKLRKETVYESKFEAELGEHLVLLVNLPPQPLSEKSIQQLQKEGTCYDAVVTRVEGSRHGLERLNTIRLRVDAPSESPTAGGSRQQVSIEQDENRLIVVLTGAFSIETAGKLETVLRGVWNKSETLVLNISGVEKTIATAVRAFTDSLSRLIRQGAPHLFLVDEREKFKGALERAGLLKFFRVVSSVDKAKTVTQATLAVFEADAAVRKSLTKMGSALGLKVVSFATGSEIETAIVAYKPSMVMLGLFLDNANSLNVARQLRESVGVPIAIIADPSVEQAEQACLEAGCSSCLVKPVTQQALAAVLHKAGIPLGAC